MLASSCGMISLLSRSDEVEKSMVALVDHANLQLDCCYKVIFCP